MKGSICDVSGSVPSRRVSVGGTEHCSSVPSRRVSVPSHYSDQIRGYRLHFLKCLVISCDIPLICSGFVKISSKF